MAYSQMQKAEYTALVREVSSVAEHRSPKPTTEVRFLYFLPIDKETEMVTNFICFIVGGFIGLITMALACVAGDADRCAECIKQQEVACGECRRRLWEIWEEIEREGEGQISQ